MLFLVILVKKFQMFMFIHLKRLSFQLCRLMIKWCSLFLTVALIQIRIQIGASSRKEIKRLKI